MSIDPGSVGATSTAKVRRWTDRETLLYALGVGAGATDTDELAFTTENSHDVEQRVLPTYGVIVGTELSVLSQAGKINFGRLVHGSQAVTLHRPLPPAGSMSVVSELTSIQDKGEGRNAVISITARGTDEETGDPLVDTVTTLVIRGAGGFGGERGESAEKVVVPDRAPDVTVSQRVREDQALLYRLSGDRNPLHSDPWFATEKAGFPKPILHGLCTYGFAGRALLHGLCDSDPARFRSMSARFSSPVFPGETLTTSIWRDADASAVFRVEAGSDGGETRPVLEDGVLALATVN